MSAVLFSLALVLALLGRADAASKTEIKGAAILDHPCGKVAVKHMDLVHAGKMAEATKLGTKAMQDGWQAMPAKDRDMMSGMMKEMSVSGAQFANDIKSSGLLAVDGTAVSLTVTRQHKDANGSSTETWKQDYVLDKGACLITR